MIEKRNRTWLMVVAGSVVAILATSNAAFSADGWWLCPGINLYRPCPCCPDDYCCKPAPCVAPFCCCGPNDYCCKPLPCVAPFCCCGCDDYCAKPMPCISPCYTPPGATCGPPCGAGPCYVKPCVSTAAADTPFRADRKIMPRE